MKGFLGRMLFSGEEVLKKVSVLSGGNRLNKFVVMRREEDISFVCLQVVVESLNRFQVQVITALSN